MSTSRGWSITRALLLGIACALLFLLPSAALIDRGAPRWAAAALGALAFPLVPVGWHVLAERGRRRRIAAAKVAPKATLTTFDRFVLRLVAVALIACGPWLVLARGRTWHALLHHAGWPVTWVLGNERASTTTGSEMLTYVPGDAEAIVWIRRPPDLTAIGKDAGADHDKDDDTLEEGVLAIKGDQLFAVVRAKKLDDVDVDKLDQKQAKKLFGHELHFVQHRIADDTVVIATDGWDAAYVARVMGRKPPARALIDRLGKAPDDAMVVAAAMPRAPIAGLRLREATAWLRVDDEQLRVDARVQGADHASAVAIAVGIQGELARLKGQLPDPCKDPVGELLDGVHVNAEGDAVSIDTRVAPEKIVAAMMCGVQLSDVDR